MFAVFKKEFFSFFYSASAYISLVVFLVCINFLLWIFPNQFNVLDSAYADLSGLFQFAPWLFLFLIPGLSMRSISEEKKQETIDLLFSRPINITELVFSKYLAILLVSIIAIFLCLVSYISVYYIGAEIGNIDSASFWGSYIGLIFLAAQYTAISLFFSTISSNQLVAFILSAFACFLFYVGFAYISSLFSYGPMQLFISNMGIDLHYNNISRGLVDSRDILYFLSVIVLFLYCSIYNLKLK
ncbi:MAG: ABC transporter permease [Marinifilaceae bacterium]|jgi:ABC-2 type transport system permease protein|nr:ABC transporter permease [Marinifilaceae bacterium]